MKNLLFCIALLGFYSSSSIAGHWIYGNQTSWLWGSRNYQAWIPENYDPSTPTPVMVALHGCLQNPSQYAGLTRMNSKADEENFIVLYPNQASYANASQCWNWMLTRNQKRNSGEVALIMGMLSKIKSKYNVDNTRVYAQGISAGAAMTSILKACYPEVFAAGSVIAGPMYKAATTITGGTTALLVGSSYSPDYRGYSAWSCAGKPRNLVTPMLVFQGSNDSVVNPRNGDQVVEQFLQASDYGDDGQDNDSVAYATTSTTSDVSDGGFSYVVENYHYADQLLVQKHTILGMNHAYPGGNDDYLFAEPGGPDATAIMWDFFESKSR